jgi:hypothetical protein
MIREVLMYKHIILITVIFLGTVVVANTDKDAKFSEANANESIALIKESLNSFKQIVKTATDEEPIILKEYKHTNWEMLNLGIPNSLLVIKGTILRQNLINSKLRYQLSLEKKKNNLSTEENLIILKQKYLILKEKYDLFLKNTKFID